MPCLALQGRVPQAVSHLGEKYLFQLMKLFGNKLGRTGPAADNHCESVSFDDSANTMVETSLQ
jgi:hypothetical protein